MICPFCRNEDSRVIDSRPVEDGSSIRRRRECISCGRRFSTSESTLLAVVKRSGAIEPFSREKVISGVRKACQGRPVSDDDLSLLAQTVEEIIRSEGQAEIPSQQVGLAILSPLRELDVIAYLRYASVYRNFTTLEDFEGEIALLRAAPSESFLALNEADSSELDLTEDNLNEKNKVKVASKTSPNLSQNESPKTSPKTLLNYIPNN
jgi:transcriptional repressor NrdR